MASANMLIPLGSMWYTAAEKFLAVEIKKAKEKGLFQRLKKLRTKEAELRGRAMP